MASSPPHLTHFPRPNAARRFGRHPAAAQRDTTLLVVVVVVVVVVRSLERRTHGILLVLDGLLALRMGALRLMVDRLVLVLLLGRHVLRVLTNLCVGLLVQVLQGIALNLLLDVLGELRVVTVGILLLEQLHVLLNVAAVDVLLVHLRVELLAFAVIAREALLVVRDVDAAVARALQGAEDAVAGGRADEANVKDASERARAVLVLDEELLAVRLIVAL